MTYIYHEFRPKGWLYGLYGVGSAGAVCPWPAEILKVAFYRKLCCRSDARGSDDMPPRALASALAMVLEDYDVFTVRDFADFLDGIDGIEGAAKTFAQRIRSDELAVWRCERPWLQMQ